MWFYLAVLSGLAGAIDKVLNRVALKNQNDALAYSIVYLALTSLFTLPFAFPLDINITAELLILLTLQAIVAALASITAFATHKTTDVSLSTIITRSRTIWVIPLGFFILGERLSSLSLIGIFITFFGLSMLFIHKNIRNQRGVHLAIISSLLGAVFSVLTALLVRDFLSPGQAAFFSMFPQVLILYTVLVIKGDHLNKIHSVLKRTWAITLIATILEAVAYITLTNAYKIGPTSAVVAVYMAMSISTIWIGVFFLNERDHLWKKIISSLIVTTGIIIIKVFS